MTTDNLFLIFGIRLETENISSLSYNFPFWCETERKDKALTSANSRNKPLPVLFNRGHELWLVCISIYKYTLFASQMKWNRYATPVKDRWPHKCKVCNRGTTAFALIRGLYACRLS